MRSSPPKSIEQTEMFPDVGVPSPSKFSKFSVIHFEREDGELVPVSVPTRKCGCGVAKCEHLVLLSDLLDSGGKATHYVATSAMHKEIRRSDLYRASLWARVKSITDGGYAAKAYAANILLEETRNSDLLVRLGGLRGLSVRDVLSPVTLSVKKWELPGKHASFAEYVRSYVVAKERVAGGN
jgi:hypothetical protein